MATSAVLPHRTGHLLKRVVFRTDEVMVLEDPGQPVSDLPFSAWSLSKLAEFLVAEVPYL